MFETLEGVVHKRTETETQHLLAEIKELRRRMARVEGRFFSPTSEQIIADLVGELIARKGVVARTERTGMSGFYEVQDELV